MNHVLFDLVTGDYHFTSFDCHIVYVTRAMFTKHSLTLKLYNSRKLSIVYTKSMMFIKQSPTLIQCHEIMTFRYLIQSSLSSSVIIIKLIAYAYLE